MKRVLVIGAGASGLIVMKMMKDRGIDVVVVDKLPVIGGVYAKSYEKTILTTSSLLTAYSEYSDGKEKDPKFWTDEEYLKYLNDFTDHFGLRENIRFRTAVERLRKCPKSGKWIADLKGNRWSPPHRMYGELPEEDPNEPVYVEEFDGVAVCTGTNQWANLPCFEGQEKFRGEIRHSEKYNNPEEFSGKRVLVVGAGESGSDICNEISKHATQIAIAIRGKHGHLIPRVQANGRVTDLNTNRCRYSNPYVFGDLVGYTNQLAKKFVASIGPKSEGNKILKKIGELNLINKTSAFSKFGCKNAGFVEAIVQRGAELHRDTFRFDENGAIFADGSRFDCDVVVACTGYKNVFPFFEQDMPEIVEYGRNPRKLFKQIFVPHLGKECAFFGFARPAFGSIPPTSEMQAKLYAAVWDGIVQLPDVPTMERIAEKDRENWEYRFGYDAKRVKGLVDFQLYMDELAEMMGCMPPLYDIMWKKPKLWFKIMYGPLTTHQYRLVGPYADPELAAKFYEKVPVGDLLEASITTFYLVTAKALSMIGFKRFQPNSI